MFLATFISSFVALFVIIDPIGITPIFVGFSHLTNKDKLRRFAIRGSIIAFAVLLFFALGGAFLLNLLEISFDAFRIAGGALLFVIAFNMIMSDPEPPHDSLMDARVEKGKDWSVFPIAIPLLAGPGSITTIILLMSKAQHSVSSQLATLLALLAACLVSMLCLVSAERISRYLGQTGSNVFARVLGIILAALSVQYIIDGIKAVFAL